jgi:parallel beta-helix repeat protein
MVNNGVTMLGYVPAECSSHDIDTTNTVNGRPLYYYADRSGITVPAGAGGVILASCADSVVEGQDLGGATVGVALAFCSNVTVRGNSCPNSTYGVFLWYSDGNTVCDNVVVNNEVTPGNWWYGIGLRYSNGNLIANNTCSGSIYGIGLGPMSDNNTISHNNCSDDNSGMALTLSSNNNTVMNNTCSYNSQYGILLQSSSNNVFTGNNLSHNTMYGVTIFSSSDGNLIWNNTFIGNNGADETYDPAHIQAFDDGAGNCWNGTDGCGNFWGDWRGPDLSPIDGVVDYPYRIGGSAGSWDHRPIAEYPGTPIPEFASVALASMVMIAALVVVIRLRRVKDR